MPRCRCAAFDARKMRACAIRRLRAYASASAALFAAFMPYDAPRPCLLRADGAARCAGIRYAGARRPLIWPRARDNARCAVARHNVIVYARVARCYASTRDDARYVTALQQWRHKDAPRRGTQPSQRR